MTDRLRLAVIIGSTRNGRFGPTVAGWFAARARRYGGLEVDVIDLAEAGLPQMLPDHDEEPPAPVRALAPGWPPPTRSRWSAPSTTPAIPRR